MKIIKDYGNNHQKFGNQIGTLGQQAKRINSQKFGLINIIYSLILVGFFILLRLQPKTLERNFVIVVYHTFSFVASLLIIFIFGIVDLKDLANSETKKEQINE